MNSHNGFAGHGHGHGHHGRHSGSWDDLAESLEHCGRLLSHCIGKSRGQGRILRILCEQGQMNQKELQEILRIQTGSMSEIAAKLENKGLILRVRDGTDKRKVLLSITDEGREWVAQRDDAAIRRQRAELFSSLTAEEQDTLQTLLDKLSEDWTQRLERERPGSGNKTT
ncbi:MAG: MarR family transcriptional regulator [Oscillospiraceae bacterium]|nr:MarR family transcriptional regulator [Oscillospiraceae bacterium]